MTSMAPDSLLWRLRTRLKASLPPRARQMVQQLRATMLSPSSEMVALHDYAPSTDPSPRPRLNLIIPTINPGQAFGGVTTALDLFISLGVVGGMDLRIILDEIDARPDRSVVDRIAARKAMRPDQIEILPRTRAIPDVPVRARDLFISYNWWATLNLQPLRDKQREQLGRALPYLYIYQEYEPGFYAFSTAHQLAWQATRGSGEWWAIYNSQQLVDFLGALGVQPSRSYIIEPSLSPSMRPLRDPTTTKERTILVYGRQTIARNCYSAVAAGLRLWAATYPDAKSWRLVSAGASHPPVKLADGAVLTSVGKLSLEDYAALLNRSAVGLSLMASPHPSYPPLEMAHFGLLTITNSFAFKDLSTAHENIRSVDDIRPACVASALAAACDNFINDQAIGWRGKSNMPGYLDGPAFPFLDQLVADLRETMQAGTDE